MNTPPTIASIEWTGILPTEEVHTCIEQNSVAYSAEEQAHMEATWSQRASAARDSGMNLFNGGICRLNRFSQRGAGIALHLAPTDYRTFVGTNLADYLPAERRANALGISALCFTSEGFLCLGRRSAKVADRPEHLHTFGGTLPFPKDGIPTSPLDHLQTELREELGLQSNEIDHIVFLGLFRDPETFQPEAVYVARLSVISQDLQRRLQQAESRDEHNTLEFFQDNLSELAGAVENAGQTTPVACAAASAAAKLLPPDFLD